MATDGDGMSYCYCAAVYQTLMIMCVYISSPVLSVGTPLTCKVEMAACIQMILMSENDASKIFKKPEH